MLAGDSRLPRLRTAAGDAPHVESTLSGGHSAVPGNALAWYNPDTKRELYLFTSGVQKVLPFPTAADPAAAL